MTIDGRWFIVGRQPAADPTPVLYPWDPNNSAMSPSATIIAPTQSHVVGSDLLWYAEVPQGIDTVGIGHLDDGTLVSITTGSPNSSGIRPPKLVSATRTRTRIPYDAPSQEARHNSRRDAPF